MELAYGAGEEKDVLMRHTKLCCCEGFCMGLGEGAGVLRGFCFSPSLFAQREGVLGVCKSCLSLLD